MTHHHFNPIAMSKKFMIKYSKHNQFNLYDYKFGTFNNPNDSFLIRTFKKLHYLGSHSFVTDKWRKIEHKFLTQHKKLDF